MQPIDLARQSISFERADVGQEASWETLRPANWVLPRSKLVQLLHSNGRLDPLNGLSVRHKVNVGMFLQNLRHPFGQNVDEPTVLAQPRSIKSQRKWGFVGGVMATEVVLEEVSELLDVVEISTRRDKRTSGQSFIESNVLPSVELVNGHLPNWEGTGRTFSSISGTLVRHAGMEKRRFSK